MAWSIHRGSVAQALVTACWLSAGCARGLIDDSQGSTAAPDASPPENPDASPPENPDASPPENPDASPPENPDASPPENPDACDDGDLRVLGANGHCYMAFHTLATYDEAAVVCAGLAPAAHLATATDLLEDMQLMSLAGTGEAWIGLNDRAVEGLFVWVTGEPLEYQNWGVGEPNNRNDEDCGIMRMVATAEDPAFNVGTWDDRSCVKLYAFLCERE